ncbi:hypothetical protein WICPIJ_009473 [Wickerhamomyces pijperi]|uniref:Uncharacterized protein n=1 Tax=Wickerhamomyces pijperi TaxID=599730 RepID=A0A9P8PMG4_WICPI|nr:hypothetical protein WICPIJ_009473 [Wickerhamomyces pijperi]
MTMDHQHQTRVTEFEPLLLVTRLDILEWDNHLCTDTKHQRSETDRVGTNVNLPIDRDILLKITIVCRHQRVGVVQNEVTFEVLVSLNAPIPSSSSSFSEPPDRIRLSTTRSLEILETVSGLDFTVASSVVEAVLDERVLVKTFLKGKLKVADLFLRPFGESTELELSSTFDVESNTDSIPAFLVFKS